VLIIQGNLCLKADALSLQQSLEFIDLIVQQHGIDVVNCSKISKLECFRKSDLKIELGI